MRGGERFPTYGVVDGSEETPENNGMRNICSVLVTTTTTSSSGGSTSGGVVYAPDLPDAPAVPVPSRPSRPAHDDVVYDDVVEEPEFTAIAFNYIVANGTAVDAAMKSSAERYDRAASA